jgi:propanediol dehydratase small subunit
MSKLPTLPLPNLVQMPLRDVLRGVSTFAEMTEQALEPLAANLPSPVRTTLRKTLRKIEGLGSDLIGPNVTHDDIFQAAAFVRGEAQGARDLKRCAVVLGFAWDAVQKTDNFPFLVSETLAAMRLSRISDGNASPERAARILRTLRDHHVAGGAPGIISDLSETDRAEIDLRLFAIAVWLLADRAETLPEEVQLLDMALAFTRAYEAAVVQAMAAKVDANSETRADAPTDLAQMLQTLSGQL